MDGMGHTIIATLRISPAFTGGLRTEREHTGILESEGITAMVGLVTGVIDGDALPSRDHIMGLVVVDWCPAQVDRGSTPGVLGSSTPGLPYSLVGPLSITRRQGWGRP
jgi:hypothetical protein